MKRSALALAVLLLTSGVAVRANSLTVELEIEFGIAGTDAREAMPVVLTGAQLPSWSRLPAVGSPQTWPAGVQPGTVGPLGDNVRSAHHGELIVPPDTRTGVAVDQIVAYRWRNGWIQLPVQVDERFPYFLANAPSDFSPYSATDEELTYAWDAETWKKTSGECMAEYAAGDDEPMADPVAALDDDDEIVFMASDAGARAPAGAAGPKGTGPTRQEVAVGEGFVYLFLSTRAPRFNPSNGYVRYVRDANADEWIDRDSFPPGDPESLGTSNSGYGPNLAGTVCTDGVRRASTDRFVRDGVTVSTAAYRWRASGRWLIRDLQIAAPGRPRRYGPDLLDRWKGRAFSLSPDRDDEFSPGGFEEEQTNWEANSTLLGERAGPVRAIREVWGADSGTNTTQTQTFYRDAITHRSRLRVHPIPPSGIYSYWDYNRGVAVRYFDPVRSEGVAIDGQNDDIGNVNTLGDLKVYTDVPDPTFNAPVTVLNWEQISGRDSAGSVVSIWEVKGLSSAQTPTAVPFYRDDACLDDGTGSDPVARPWPGEAQSDPRLEAYSTLPCAQKQGAYGSSGVHFLFTGDSDNAFQSKPVNEVDAQQWQFFVPTPSPRNVGQTYANNVIVPMVPTVSEQANRAAR